MLQRLNQLPLDPIFQLLLDYKADPRSEKMNLGIGVYSDEEGKPFVFPSVKEAIDSLDIEDFDYQPIIGKPGYIEAIMKLMFDHRASDCIAGIAACGGTHSCRIFSDLMAREGRRDILIATPTWGNHLQVFDAHHQILFPHLKSDTEVNVERYRQEIERAKPGTILLLHGGSTHNPTGRNLSPDELSYLIPLMEERDLVVFIDFAYFGMGDLWEDDKTWLHLLWDSLEDIALGISFSKNASLYEHRTGALFVKTDQKKSIESHLQDIVRRSVSMAPVFGQEILMSVLEDSFYNWQNELRDVRNSIAFRKTELLKRLPEQFSALLSTRGMFALMPLTEEQILRLRKEFAIYLPTTRRINFAGIQTKALDRIAEGIKAVL